MYEAYWGLKEKPFENTPDPRFIYYSQQHQEALARMMYVVSERKSAVLLSGEFGSGKTLLSRLLCQQLEQEDKYKTVSIFNPRLSSLEFIKEIVYQLEGGRDTPAEKIELLHNLHKILLSNYDSGKHTIILIDEAQAISDSEIFEELRLLLNFQLNNAFLLTIILLGQPELIEKVINLPQLRQRIAVRFHLMALSEEETKEYIQHRLKIAQAKRLIFEEEALKEIFVRSGGIPRQINSICDLALLAGYGSGLNSINKETVIRVSQDLEGLSLVSEHKPEQ